MAKSRIQADRALWHRLNRQLQVAYKKLEKRARDGQDVSAVVHSINKLKEQICNRFGLLKIVSVARRKSDRQLEFHALALIDGEARMIHIAPSENGKRR